MSYETVIKQINNTPAQYLNEISHFIEFLNNKKKKELSSKTVVQKFLELSWEDDRNAEEIISEIENRNGISHRFEDGNALFD